MLGKATFFPMVTVLTMHLEVARLFSSFPATIDFGANW